MTREKDVTVQLCSFYRIPQVVLSRVYSGKFLSGLGEFTKRTVKLLYLAIKYKPDALLGTSLSIGIVGKTIRRPSFVFNEDDAYYIPLFSRIAYPTSDYIVTPESLAYENYGRKHLTYPGYHELAYLHPDLFEPDPEVPRSIGLDPGKPYFILRFVSLKAHHDAHASGLPHESTLEILSLLSRNGRVLITSEGKLRDDFVPYQFPLPPEKFHDVLAFSSIYIGDSQTVSIEAGMLGIPNIRCNTFVDKISCLRELDYTHKLTKGFRPGQTGDLLATMEEWLKDLDKLKQEHIEDANTC